MLPDELCTLLHELFTAYDEVCDQHGALKIETCGDAWIGAAGCVAEDESPPRANATRLARAALDMQACAGTFKVGWSQIGPPRRSEICFCFDLIISPLTRVRVAFMDASFLSLQDLAGRALRQRCGLHAGPATAGIVGSSSLRYHLVRRRPSY